MASWKSSIHRGLAPYDLPLNVATQIEIDLATSCWQWTGHTQFGYGRVRAYGKRYQAHRLVYERTNGPISEDLQLDHLCENRACCNPSHLQPVTAYENYRRRDRREEGFCRRGHPRSVEGKKVKGGYACRACIRLLYHVRKGHVAREQLNWPTD